MTDIRNIPHGAVHLFSSVEGFFGPVQHDAHVMTRRRHNWLTDREAQSALASLSVMHCKDQIIAEFRAKCAAAKQREAMGEALQAAE